MTKNQRTAALVKQLRRLDELTDRYETKGFPDDTAPLIERIDKTLVAYARAPKEVRVDYQVWLSRSLFTAAIKHS